MAVRLLKPRFALRQLFDEVVELAPEVREEEIASLDLPPAIGLRLQAMVVFDDLVERAPEQRQARIAELDLPEQVRARLDAMLAADTQAPVLLKASAAEAIDRLRDVLVELHSGTRPGGDDADPAATRNPAWLRDRRADVDQVPGGRLQQLRRLAIAARPAGKKS